MSHPIPDYDLDQPTSADLVGSLEQIMGPDQTRSAIDRALHALGAETDELTQLSSAELLDLANILIKERGLISVLARSFSIRLSSYLLLEAGGR
ncbi:hypothetical protein DB30_00788 [Enhygromyxa salina]|uniref:Uncharacterized protein n=1 Tax=Enhygromyxa salina TaxID=215803 RepID=A0A0C1Z5W7_9BACT|nr:hypothetical protein [Enhygromyxa salina]KIG13014.1 hypothetical protein DB30_00788 [Enhygromyxa salina]